MLWAEGCTDMNGLDKHDQTPGALTDDPLRAINEFGNYGLAIALLGKRVTQTTSTAADHELFAYSLRSVGRPAEAAEQYRSALRVDPAHPRAGKWLAHSEDCERTARNGAYLQRPHGITAERLTSPSHVPPGSEAFAWVVDDTGWVKPNGYIPPKTLGHVVMNKVFALVFDALNPVGRLVNRLVPERPDSTGRWTRLPDWLKGVLRLADLASRRDWMMDHARLPPGVTENDKDQGPSFSPHGFSPDGRGNNPQYRGVGGVGTSVPFHGLPPDYVPRDRSGRADLPAAAALARDFGYRRGAIVEAATASAHVWGHLQMLVHDVMQTAPDDQKKHPVPVAADSDEAAMGITNVHYRTDAMHPLGGHGNGRMNGVTGAWDMSTIYGSSIEQIARLRTDPATAQPCPDGRLYLVPGAGGMFLPTERNEAGKEMILTGFARNMTAPLEAEHTLYARHHNWVCGVLRERHPGWPDNQVFNIARRVVSLTYVKIHTAPWTDAVFAHPSVVQGLHANIFGRREWDKPADRQRIYDPYGGNHPIADGLVSNQELDYAVPEAKGSNFADAYRFGHTIIPDIHYFPRIGEPTDKQTSEAINIKDLRELDGHRFLTTRGLGFAFYGLMHTRLGAPVAGNYAELFRRMDTEEGMIDLFEAEIIKDRQRGAPAYNDYLRSHNLPPLASFADLFTDASASSAQVDALKRHYPGGVEDLDTPLGLLLNQYRPAGFAITNPGFQTFVFEATARIAKQAHLTRLWSPEHVGWTAINLVEAFNKEKLLHLHCPELRGYLAGRPNRNTYEYMGTSHATAPGEHPLAEILTYGKEDLADTGLGDPWRDVHFDERALAEHYLIRVRHLPSKRSFIVDLSEAVVRYDRDGDGRIHRSEVMREPVDGVSPALVLAAAADIRSAHPIPWPGRPSPQHPDFVSGWRLTPAEVKRLKLFEGDQQEEGVPARLTDLQVHVLVFNLGDDIEHSRLSENLQGWRGLERSPMRAVMMTLASALRFGANLPSMAVPLSQQAMAKTRPARRTGIFDADGMIDHERLEAYRAALQQLAGSGGGVSKPDFIALLEQRNALDMTTRRQWDTFFRLMQRRHGSETITVDDFDKFYDGRLLFEAFEAFAPKEVVAKLSGPAH